MRRLASAVRYLGRRHLATLLVCLGMTAPLHASETWILVESDKRLLHVMQDDRPIKTIHDTSVGNEGAARHRIMGSNRTPKGEFKVNAINQKSRFRTFYRLDYPTPDHAREAYLNGTYSYEDYVRYFQYKERHGYPPQTTKLGGQIGIHGLGGRDEYAHRRVNWTEGCVAVSDPEIDQLAKWLGIGTRVVIR